MNNTTTTLQQMEDLMEDMMETPVEIIGRTINLGNGSPDEQEDFCLIGEFNGNSDNAGRTIRYHFDSEGKHYYFFWDEILSIEKVK